MSTKKKLSPFRVMVVHYYTFSTIKPSWADKKFEKQIKRLEKEWYKIGK